MPKGFRPNDGAIDAFLGPRGPFGLFLNEYGQAVVASAKRKSLIGYNAPRRETPNVGILKKSIKAEPVRFGPGGLEVVISAYRRRGAADVAFIIHQGHKEIIPKPNKPLVFYTRTKGTGKITVTARPVDDDGDPRLGKGFVRAVGGHPYLTRALEDMAAMEGGEFRVKILRPPSPAAPPKLSFKYINR